MLRFRQLFYICAVIYFVEKAKRFLQKTVLLFVLHIKKSGAYYTNIKKIFSAGVLNEKK